MRERLTRERLTITLDAGILNHIDAAIDGTNIRNRSHAIEHLLTKALGPRVRTAVILAGGKGVRMQPFTFETPKPLLPIHGRPILEHILFTLRDHGIQHVILMIGYLGEKIKAHCGDGRQWGLKIEYAEDGPLSGTGAPLRKLASRLTEPFILSHGDVLFTIDLEDLIKHHYASGATATMSLTSVDDPSEYGAVRLHGQRIAEFSEKPKTTHATSRLVNAGVYCVNPEMLSLIPKKSHAMLESDVFPTLVEQQTLFGYPFEGQWFDIGTPAQFERAVREWKG